MIFVVLADLIFAFTYEVESSHFLDTSTLRSNTNSCQLAIAVIHISGFVLIISFIIPSPTESN